MAKGDRRSHGRKNQIQNKMKIKKEIRKELRRLASQLPKSYRDVDVYRGRLGASLINMGMTKLETTGERILPHKTYVVKISSQLPIDQVKRLETMYKRLGIDGVRKYCQDMIDINTPKKIGNFDVETF